MIIKYHYANSGYKVKIQKSFYKDESKHVIKNWEFPTFYNAVNVGFEIVWDDEPLMSHKGMRVSDNLIQLETNIILQTNKNTNVFLFSNCPNGHLCNQTLETDWWTGNLKLLFYHKNFVLKKGTIIAQGLCIPRQETSIKECNDEEIDHSTQAKDFLQENKDKYITRESDSDVFPKQDNLYEVLSNMNNRNELPQELHKKEILGNKLKLVK